MVPLGVVGDVIGRVRRDMGRVVGAGGRVAERFVAEVRRQVDAGRLDDREAADERVEAGSDATRAASRAVSPPVAETVGTDSERVTPTADELALPDYDLLPAAHVVAALGDLEPSERDVIEAYERARRHRRTILGRLEQLREAADT